MRKILSLLLAAVLLAAAVPARANTAADALKTQYTSAQLFQPPKSLAASQPLFAGTGSSASANWNEPLPANPQLTPNSDAQAALMAQEMGINPFNTAYGNRWVIAYKIYVASSDTPLKTACSQYVLRGTSWSYNQDFHNATITGVPVPDGTLSYDGGSDHSMAIYQASTNTYWDFFVGLDPAPAGTVDPQGRPCDFVYYGGGRIKNIGTLRWGYPWPQYPLAWYTASPGYFRNNTPTEDRLWGRMASALPVIAGLITPQEWNAATTGQPIQHKLSLDVRWAKCGAPVWPAGRNDCLNDGLARITEGSVVRIDPSVTCWGHDGDPGHERSYTLCRAMQDYGAVVKDQTGGGYAIGFRSSGGYPSVPDSTFGSSTFSNVPSQYFDWNRAAWSHLQVLAEPAHSEWAPNCYC